MPVDTAALALLQRIDTAGQLANFGTWTHDLVTGARHWDAQVWRFWGRAPQAGALDLAQALDAIHPDDRDQARALQEHSLATPGR